MSTLALATLLHVSLAATGTDSYTNAHRVTAKTGKPMVIMVSANWCGACKEMERSVLPQIKKRGVLEDVSFAVVDVDREQKLARRLIGRGSIPQLLMYRKSGKGWLRRRLIGGQSTKAVEKFIHEGVARDKAAKKALAEKQGEPSGEKRAETGVASKPTVQPVSKR